MLLVRRADFLRPIWSHVSGMMRFCNVSNKGTASKFVQISEKMQLRPWQWLGKKAWAIHRKSKLTDSEKGRDRWKGKCLLIIFFDIKGIVHKEFVLTGQTVNSAYYCDILWWLHENVQILNPNFGDKITGCCIMTTQHLTFNFPSRYFFLPKATRLSSPTHPTFLCFPDWR
jgi:hypothetical protein